MSSRNRFILRAAIASILSAAVSAAAAADDASGDAEPLEQIVVTGSHIKGAVEDAALPVTVLDRDEIERQGSPSSSGKPLRNGSRRGNSQHHSAKPWVRPPGSTPDRAWRCPNHSPVLVFQKNPHCFPVVTRGQMRRSTNVCQGETMQRASSVRAMISAERATRAPARAPTRPPSSRAGVVRSLTQLGVSNPNFVMHFTTPDQLGWHLADRYVATLRKRGGVLALMNAVESDPTRVRVGGAMLQDGRGSSSSVMIGGRNFFSGVERGHVAMGTYTLDGESVSQRVLRRLRAASVDSLRVPALVELLAFNLGLDGGTEGVPAMINRSSGIAIEKGVIRSLDVNKPLASRQGEGAMERSYIVELERLFEMLVFDPATVVAPIESRLMAITSGNAREILQNPADTKNLMFGGKERTYLEEVLAQLESQYGDFAKLTGEFERDIPSNARHFAELSAIARDEWAAVMDSIPEIEKPG